VAREILIEAQTSGAGVSVRAIVRHNESIPVAQFGARYPVVIEFCGPHENESVE